MKHRVVSIFPIFLLLSTIAILSACSDSDGPDGETGIVRFVNAVADEALLDIIKDDSDTVATGLTYLESTDYMEFSAQGHDFTATRTGTFEEIATKKMSVSTDDDYTLIICGTISDGDTLLLRDDNSAPPEGRVSIRMANAVDTKLKVDAYVVPVEGPYPVAPVNEDMGYKKVSDYINGVPGAYFFEFKNSLTDELVARSEAVGMEDGDIRTVILTGGIDGYAVNVLVDRD